MANNDYFAEIALTQHPLGNQDKEVVPVKKAGNYFEQTEESFPYGSVKIPQEKSDEERFAEFQEGMDALRGRYRPFMMNRLPAVKEPETLALREFQFRYLKEHEVFSSRNEADDWEPVTIPDYRGPVGKWKAYYRTVFSARSLREEEHAVLSFQCVDYKAVIYVNGCYVGAHEGFFAPFSFDVSDYLQEENELIIQVENDVSILGEGPVLDGDKIYAATGPGWDDPVTGWHHCPAGAGVFGKVTLEYRPAVCITDIFVRPDIDEGCVELRMGVMNYSSVIQENFQLEVVLLPKNFEDPFRQVFQAEIKVAGVGSNEYRYRIPMKGFRLWDPETPYLYGAVCTVTKDGKIVSQKRSHFGMRKFVSDETAAPKGRLFLNNRPVVLRGANEMGHLQQCVMKGDLDQLVDDILIAKLCHVNYYRITQRPVQEEIYDYMDMLGMMNQSDLPLFSYLRRPQVCEAVKQAGEMEHLLRSHPSAILVTFINEPVSMRPTEDPNSKFSKRYNMKGHRHLQRDELEAFFVAARKVIYIENPDRVIKNVEGDYDPPTTEGMPDFHCYTMWYSNHGVPIGKLYRGYLPPVKEGWMIGCGEYGAEGLDNESLMRAHYPKEWMETDEKGDWYPVKIVRQQTNGAHGDWYPEQHTISDWVRESQLHQARATTMMTDAFRRRADVLNHTAIHLLIDAWPAGWMKTIVGCDRVPKKAYYAYMDSLTPLRVNLRGDRQYLYSGETYDLEAWALNDTSYSEEVTMLATMSMEGKALASYKLTMTAPAATAVCAGLIPLTMPQVEAAKTLTVDAVMKKQDGSVLNVERRELYVFPPYEVMRGQEKIACIGENAEKFAKIFGYELTELPKADKILISATEGYEEEIRAAVERGATAVLLTPDVRLSEYTFGDLHIVTKKGPKLFIVMTNEKTEGYRFDMLYNADADYIDFIGRKVIESDQEGEELLFTYAKSGADGVPAPKLHLPLAEKFTMGSGRMYVISLILEGRVGANANLDQFLIDCLEGRI